MFYLHSIFFSLAQVHEFEPMIVDGGDAAPKRKEGFPTRVSKEFFSGKRYNSALSSSLIYVFLVKFTAPSVISESDICFVVNISSDLFFVLTELKDKEEKFALAAEGVNTCHLSAMNAEYVAKLIRKHGTNCQVGLS